MCVYVNVGVVCDSYWWVMCANDGVLSEALPTKSGFSPLLLLFIEKKRWKKYWF
jgi:hypothetical protein